MENKSFKENTIGSFALTLLEEVKASDKDPTSYIIQKTDAVKKILAVQQARGGDINIGSAQMETIMRSIDIDAAAQAYLTNDTSKIVNPLAGTPITDIVTVCSKANNSSASFETAPSKAISTGISLIKQGTLSSTRVLCIDKNKSTNNRSSVKDEFSRTDIPVFQAREESYKDGIVNVKCDISDVNICSHLDWGDLADYDTLNLLISSARYASENMTISTYKAYGLAFPDDCNMFLTSLRLQNRSLEDSIFEEVYCMTYPEPDISDISNYKKFIDLKKRFHANLSVIGKGNNISSTTVQVGISRLDIVTSTDQTVSSTKRIGSVKQNKVNSYVHTKPVDTGLCTAVLASEEAKHKFLNGFCFDWVKVAGLWLQNESRHFLKLPTVTIPDELKAKIVLEKPSSQNSYDLLKISSHSLAELSDEFINRCYTLSDKVIKEEQFEVDRNIFQSIQSIIV